MDHGSHQQVRSVIQKFIMAKQSMQEKKKQDGQLQVIMMRMVRGKSCRIIPMIFYWRLTMNR